MKNFLFSLPLIALLLSGCDSKEDFPKANTSGDDISSPLTIANTFPLKVEDWAFGIGNAGSTGNPNYYQPRRITSEASSGSPVNTTGLVGMASRTSSYSLSISATTISDTASLSYWYFRIAPPTTLRAGKSLTLKAKVHVENVQGKGASLVLRGDKGSKTAVLFATTEGQATIRGNADFREYSVTLPYSGSVDYILVYLTMLPQTIGRVTFTDVSVQSN